MSFIVPPGMVKRIMRPAYHNLFQKDLSTGPAFERTGLSTMRTATPIVVEVGGRLFSIPSNTAVQMPALTAGVDYFLYPCADEVLRLDANASAPTGFDATNSRRIGGVHCGPGAMATGINLGGDATPQLLAHTIWDEKWRPACPDMRGMGYVGGATGWVDLYLLGTNWIVDGTSRMGATIADGSSPPKKPLNRGGNGSTSYTSLTQFEASEVMRCVGKTLLDKDDFADAAFGVKEAVSRGNDPITTGLSTTNAGSSKLDYELTSMYMYQAAGVQWIWGRDVLTKVGGADYAAATAFSWKANTGGRGSLYTEGAEGLAAALFGGDWASGSPCGSRASFWSYVPWNSSYSVGARGRCDHLSHV